MSADKHPVQPAMPTDALPREGCAVEFWSHRMSQHRVQGAGIQGRFKRGLFWSLDAADHYSPSEIACWIGREDTNV